MSIFSANTYGDSVTQHEVTLENEHVQAVVSPLLGRVMAFQAHGEANVLWVNPEEAPPPSPDNYFQYGGDKLWTTVQLLWPRVYRHDDGPPLDNVTDGGAAWRLVEQSPAHVLVESDRCPYLDIIVRRHIELVTDAPELIIRNTIERTERNIFPVHIWSVTQVRHPDDVLLDVTPERPLAEPWTGFSQQARLEQEIRELDHAIRWPMPTTSRGKVGTLGRWVAAVYEDVVFAQVSSFHADAAYPDASNVQVFVNPQRFTELELLSPTVHLQPGEQLQSVTRWRLEPRADRSPAAIAEALDAFSTDPSSDR